MKKLTILSLFLCLILGRVLYANTDVNIGEAIEINATAYERTDDLQPPSNLQADVVGNDVNLCWDSPEPTPTGEWITWCNPAAFGNGVGTLEPAIYEVAHRFDADDLSEYHGSTLTHVQFVPTEENCVYTVKVWTGGSATDPGTLVHSQLTYGLDIYQWNEVLLTTMVPIPISGELWIGYEANTAGGLPLGCDEGPVVEGKGNMINEDGWCSLTDTSPTFRFNWSIQGYVDHEISAPAFAPGGIVEALRAPQTGTFSMSHNPGFAQSAQKMNGPRALLGYKVYRDGVAVGNVNNANTLNYTDENLDSGIYRYAVTAIYSSGESLPATIDVNVNLQLADAIFSDGFEDYADFSTDMTPWTLLDLDNSDTYCFTGIDFPGSGSPMAYTVFNPSATVPPIEKMDVYEGEKMAACFAAVNSPNNDWLITPQISLEGNSMLKFAAKSHITQYPEQFRVGVSTMPTIIHQEFHYLSGAEHVVAPAEWTEYIYDLSAYNNQDVYIAIRCVSDDAFVFYVDHVSVHSGDITDNDDEVAPVLTTVLQGNHPNPFNPTTTIRYSVKEAAPVSIEIYNLRGQRVKRLVNEIKAGGQHNAVWNGTDDAGRVVSSGVYFYKMNTGKYNATKKMIMIK